MDNLKSLVLPAFLGLAAGVAHGILSHQADLPMSLTEQLIESLTPAQTVSYSPQD
ncbi:MAG: hypothetical protein ACFB14_25990 [Leptolyngbyaceae cyanobacterium]